MNEEGRGIRERRREEERGQTRERDSLFTTFLLFSLFFPFRQSNSNTMVRPPPLLLLARSLSPLLSDRSLSPSSPLTNKQTTKKKQQAGRPQDDEFAVPPPDDASDVDSRQLSDLEDDDDENAQNNNNNQNNDDGDDDAAERATSPGDTEGEDLMENMEG